MISKIKFLSFLKDKHKSYVLNLQVEEVVKAINNIPQSTGLWSDSNIELKYFDGKFFSIQLIRLNAVTSPRLASKLFGEIEKQNDLETVLQTSIRPSPGMNFLLFVCILGGLVFLGKFVFFHGPNENLLWGILMTGLIPFLLIWYKNVSDVAITGNFEDYLFKELKR